jgi:hypothetical protein
VAFANTRRARLPLARRHRRDALTTLQASLDAADWSVAPPRFDPGISPEAGDLATGDPGVSPDRTSTGWPT